MVFTVICILAIYTRHVSSLIVSVSLYVTEMTSPAAVAVATAAAAEPVKPEAEVVVSRHSDIVAAPSVTATTSRTGHTDCRTTTPPVAAVDPIFSAHLPPPSARDRRVRRSPPPPARHGIETPASRPTSHTAPARPLARLEPELVAAAARVELESLPVGFEMTTACPICQTPIPFDAESSDAFSRHVDECISRVTREGPSASASSRDPVSTDRTCPVCNMAFSEVDFSQTNFERHVNDHFVDDDAAAQQFEPMLS